ncbi:FAD-binding oxidoreductase [Paenibacillus protaetiae]|uniref:FAD-binding oxidoreductase n=1 Tax=Paenibacillus protaetiae TaxID=2509456 RepID=A0A4P6F7Q9_9BACL|nr:FAD-binding oxidoreductase [Paenibacillus protaetiae]QAY66458.1 FAD-binding oxidoreductase [Paenibacillus protaetiae]
MSMDWKTRLKEQLDPDCLLWDDASLAKYSMDYHHFSPVLARELKDKVAECIVSPRSAEELDLVLSILTEEKVPVTVRGNGTGNYGQAVPLTGGAVINLANMNKVLEIGDGYMRVEPGARLGKMDEAARECGQEVMMMPSTFHTASIGGFISGGFGGIGSITWGTIWDGFVEQITVKTIESPPQTFTLTGDEIRPYLHTYGVVGIISELRVKLAPRVEWMQWAVTFEAWQDAVRFAMELASDDSMMKRLVSVHEWPVSQYFKALKLPAERSAALLEIDEQDERKLLEAISRHGGQIDRRITADKYRKGIGVSDFTWNHTTLWARKADTSLTYLQTTHTWDHVFEEMAVIKSEFPEVMQHLEFNKQAGKLRIAGLPLLTFTSDERLNQLIRRYNEIGASVSNPHTWDLEDGGRSFVHRKLWELKQANDPYLLLNQLKLKEYKPDLTVS